MRPKKKFKCVDGRMYKLQNRRIGIAHDGEDYLVKWKHLAMDDNLKPRVVEECRMFTPEAMFALVEAFMEMKGPLPKGARW